MSRLRVLLVIVVVVSAAIPAAHSQTVTGQISGRIVDPQGAIIPGANVQLTSDLSGQVREFISDQNGSFIFTNLVPGNYSIKIAQPGFKTYEQKAISVSAQERVDLHNLKMQLGELSTTVTVEADKVHVATDSSDRGLNISRLEIEDTLVRGGNSKQLLRGLPGVAELSTGDTRGWNVGMPTINGGRSNQLLLTIDGVTSQDSGAPGTGGGYLSPSIEAIGEVKVLTSNYNAEYGARAGGQVNFTIRNGTPDFHGSAAMYYRNEGLNANEWFNNRTGTKRPRYRYENVVATIGGPVLIPGTGFNKSRNKLFFFFSYDYLHNNGYTNPQRYTMPTALERAGDFSQTVTTTGVLIPINDPLTGKQFPGNVIPSSRWSSTGQAMMNLFPAPNTTDPTGLRQYNFESVNPTNQPRSDIIVRVDYPISPKATVYGRFLRDWQSQGPYGGILGPLGGGWRQYPHQYAIASSGYVATLIYSFRPNLTSETVYGINMAHQMVEQLDDAMYANSLLPLKDAKGQPVPLIHIYDGNYMNLRPNINFGLPSGFSAQSSGQGVTSAPHYGFDSRWPFDGTDRVHNVTSNLTWVKRSHNVKTGMYYRENEPRREHLLAI